MSGDLEQLPLWVLISIYRDMKSAHRWVEAILDHAVESQSKIISPGFAAAARQHFRELPDVVAPLEDSSYDRWAALIDFLSEPHVRRFVEHLIVNTLMKRYIKDAGKDTSAEKEEQAGSGIITDAGNGPGKSPFPDEGIEKQPLLADYSCVSVDELPKGKNYEKNRKRVERNRKKRMADKHVASVSGTFTSSGTVVAVAEKTALGEASSAITLASQERTSPDASATKALTTQSERSSLAEALIDAGVDVSALNYLMISVPDAVASALKEEMPKEAVNSADAELTSPQPDDSMADAAASSLQVTSADPGEAKVLPDLAPLNLDLGNSGIDIGQPADDDLVADGSTISNIDLALVEGQTSGSDSGESEESDTPPVLTIDGRNAYEVTDLTVEDHPDVNKFMEIKFNCEYCQKETSESRDSETTFFCPGCGPCSAIRYCSKTCLLAGATHHQSMCGLQPGDYPVIWDWTSSHMHSKFPYITSIGGEMSPQCFRQMVYAAVLDSEGVVTLPFITYYNVSHPASRSLSSLQSLITYSLKCPRSTVS
jgi:hypothetical protein